jgi:hypothetical protein
MATWLRRICAAFLLVCIQWGGATADTAAGVAAYDKGDYATALKLLKPEADKGDAEAEVKYGLMFAKGRGVAHDGAEAFKWFQKSSAQGNVEAMYCMGVAYDVGDAGAKDLAKAAEWYRKAAEKGYDKAQYNLAVMLQFGDGIPVNLVESAEWLRKSAEQNDADAEARLAYNHVKGGLGVEQDWLAARYWAGRAKQHGSDKGKELSEALQREFAKMERENHVPRTAGGDGSSLERAIQLPDEKTEMKGVDAEYAVLRYFFPGYRNLSQAVLTGPDHRPYDVLTIEKDGKKREVYFDISNFFGQME